MPKQSSTFIIRNSPPVSAITAGLLVLSGLEGWAGKEYKEHELTKRK